MANMPGQEWVQGLASPASCPTMDWPASCSHPCVHSLPLLAHQTLCPAKHIEIQTQIRTQIQIHAKIQRQRQTTMYAQSFTVSPTPTQSMVHCLPVSTGCFTIWLMVSKHIYKDKYKYTHKYEDNHSVCTVYTACQVRLDVSRADWWCPWPRTPKYLSAHTQEDWMAAKKASAGFWSRIKHLVGWIWTDPL